MTETNEIIDEILALYVDQDYGTYAGMEKLVATLVQKVRAEGYDEGYNAGFEASRDICGDAGAQATENVLKALRL